MYAYLYKGYPCTSTVTVKKVPFVQVRIHTDTNCTFVTVMLLLQRYPVYKNAYLLVQRVQCTNELIPEASRPTYRGVWGGGKQWLDNIQRNYGLFVESQNLRELP